MNITPTTLVELLELDNLDIESRIPLIFTPTLYSEHQDIVDEWMPKIIKKLGSMPNGVQYGNDYLQINEIRLRAARAILHYGSLSNYDSTEFKNYYSSLTDHLYVMMSVKEESARNKLIKLEAPEWYISLYPQGNHTFWSHVKHKDALCVLPSVIDQFYKNPDFTTVSDLRLTLDYILKYATNNLATMSTEDASYLSYVGILKDSELQEKTGLCNLYVESILNKISPYFMVNDLDKTLSFLDMTGDRMGFEVWCSFNKHAKDLPGEVLPELGVEI